MSKQTDIKMVNKTTFSDKLKTYLKHPGSFIVMLLVLLAAVITFAVLIFLIAYILINGLPHITPSLFSLEYSSENASVVPAFVNTIVMTLLLRCLSGFFPQSSLWSTQRGETGLLRLSVLRRRRFRVSRLSCTACLVCCSLLIHWDGDFLSWPERLQSRL